MSARLVLPQGRRQAQALGDRTMERSLRMQGMPPDMVETTKACDLRMASHEQPPGRLQPCARSPGLPEDPP